MYRSKGSEVAPTAAHAVGSSGGGLVAISRSSAGCPQVSKKPMRPAVLCLIVFSIIVAILVVVAVAIIVVAVVVATISVAVCVALITAVTIVVVV